MSSCPGSGGFYGLLETVTPGRDAFTISLNGNGNWDLLGISALPSDKVFACGGDEKATNQAPIKYTNSHPLSCTKDPNTTLLITVHDSIHDVGPFTINSVADDLKIKLGEGQQQLDGLRGEILALKASIAQLDASVNSQFVTVSTNINNQLKRLNTESNNGYTFTNTEPASNGGGNNADTPPGRCPIGSYVVGIQPFKATNGIRSIVFRCGPIPSLSVP